MPASTVNGTTCCCRSWLNVASTEKGTIMTEVRAPLAGNIWAVLVEVGSKVEADDEIAIIEALKMENLVYAPCAGTVSEVKVKKGDKVEEDDILLVID
jgi:biotin carboxyl carrier protein